MYCCLQITVRVMNYYQFMNSKVLFKEVRHKPAGSTAMPVMVHISKYMRVHKAINLIPQKFQHKPTLLPANCMAAVAVVRLAWRSLHHVKHDAVHAALSRLLFNSCQYTRRTNFVTICAAVQTPAILHARNPQVLCNVSVRCNPP